MNSIKTIRSLKRKALTKHKSVRQWLIKAKVNPSVYYRILNAEASPTVATLNRLERAAR